MSTQPSYFHMTPSYRDVYLNFYLSHCYTIAWDRQIIKSLVVCLCVYVCVYVCMCVCLWARLRSHFSTDLHEIWQEPLGSESEKLIRLGSKSENAFPYFISI